MAVRLLSSSRTYLLRLSGRVEVSVELTGMTTDFDCNVATPLAGGPSQIRLVVCEDDGVPMR